MATRNQYRIVKGYGKALKEMERMSLESNDDARDWLERRWGNEEGYRIQCLVDDCWINIPLETKG
jgi:hypothetical protein